MTAPKAEESADQLLAMAAHDLRAPLRQLALRLAMLERRCAADLSAAAQEELAATREDARRLQNMLEGLLAWARGEAAEEPQQMLLAPVVHEVLAELHARLQERGVDVAVDISPDLQVVARPLSLQRILSNLIRNAAEHAGPAPQVRLQTEVGPGQLEICVADNGPGIPQALRERVFAPFERGDAPRKRPGSGLGLAICARLVAAEGGSIKIEEGASGGALFRVRLPQP
nr:HAMP domain-containing histidine kinase [Oceanococcus sp. HetDA_MAG_MS8]